MFVMLGVVVMVMLVVTAVVSVMPVCSLFAQIDSRAMATRS